MEAMKVFMGLIKIANIGRPTFNTQNQTTYPRHDLLLILKSGRAAI